jgi:SAM-dependent methyltransferase
VTAILLEACPACGHGELLRAFPDTLASDNSLGRLAGKRGVPEFPGFDVREHLLSLWSVCGHCALMFARRRPSSARLAEWYPPLFQLSEERGYNTAPLPESYLRGKREGAEKLHRLLGRHGVFAGAKSLIHFRTGPGHLLDAVKRGHPEIDVYGLEYFEHPANHAKTLVGADKVKRIAEPEPANPFPLNRFDVIIANHFLTHAHEPVAFLRYLRGLLSETGKLVIYNELDHALSFRSMTAYPRGLNFFHKQLFTRASLDAFVRAQGLEPVEIDTAPDGKRPKYIMLLCSPANATSVASGDAKAALSLIRSWRQNHRLYRTLRFVIEPVRRALRG